ncbi:MAG TPA: hypothetical protein VJ508_16215 [Saprospiraceae bacterium]|nr:hypothetical protein [Saprospiraceae bacterium]
MKSLLISMFLFAGLMYAVSTNAQQSGVDSTGLPGDNFSLQGALQLFHDAATIEDFEKALNTESNHVNNLDLDGDGDIDYVRVIDKTEKNAHVFILQVAVSEKENQDVAVIELEKTGDANAVIQIVGDEDLYGDEVIVEPSSDMDTAPTNKGKGPDNDYDYSLALSLSHSLTYIHTTGVVVNVWLWPSVTYVYGPVYRPWISPWRWHYYPVWWRPWHPLAWHVWHPFFHPYHRSFVVVGTHRVTYAHSIYRPYRTTSVTVHRRNVTTINNYHVHQTKTTVTGPRGGKTTVKKTTVRGPKGHVKAKKTTVTHRRH